MNEDRTERPTTSPDVTAADMAAIFTGPVEGRDYQEMPPSAPAAPATGNARFSFGLISDVFEVLDKHGYRLPDVEGSPERHRALGQTTAVLLDLVEVYEGKRLGLGEQGRAESIDERLAVIEREVTETNRAMLAIARSVQADR